MDEFTRTPTLADVKKKRKLEREAANKRKLAREAAKKAGTGAGQRQLASTAASRLIGGLSLPASVIAFLGIKGIESVKQAKKARKQLDESALRAAKADQDKSSKLPPSQQIKKGRQVLDSYIAGGRKHKVKKGDTLSEIAKANNTTVDRLMELNKGIKNKDLIFPGQIIKVVSEVEKTPYRKPKPTVAPRGVKTGGSVGRKAGGRTGRGRGMGVALRGGGAVSKR